MSTVKIRPYKIIGIFLGFLLLSSIIPASAIDFSFDSEINLSSNTGDSINSQVSASGNNVFVVWSDDTGGLDDISFKRSTDSGLSFSGATIDLSSSSSVISQKPQIDSSGSNVYVVWREGNVNSDISFAPSTNDGTSFSTAIDLSYSPSVTSQKPQIASSGSDVYVVWLEANEIFFSDSANSGANFDAPVTLNSGATSSDTPQIVVSGTDVYTVWSGQLMSGGGGGGFDDILFKRITNSGSTFDTTIDISQTSGTVSEDAQIAESSGFVYVVWEEGSDILFSRSTNGGASFLAPIDIGDTGGTGSPKPQLSAVGNNVFVTWRENSTGDISFLRSTDNGASFGSKINLSDNTGSSITPVIAASNNNVTIAWTDLTLGDREIFYKASDDDGATFGSSTNLSGNSGISEFPQIALTATKAYVVWQDDTPDVDSDKDILFRAGVPSTIAISFDKTQYTLNESAQITITDVSSSTSIDANVISTTDSSGITLTLSETGVGTGTFTGSLSFDRNASSGTTLHAAAGDIITASFSGETGTASIFPITTALKVDGFVPICIDYGDIVNVEVDDPSSNQDAGTAETIIVSITSTFDPTGTTILLTETGIDTGIFGGTSSNLIFTDGDTKVLPPSTVTITQADSGSNTAAIDSITVFVNSTSDTTGFNLQLNETSATSGLFNGTLSFSLSATTPGSILLVAPGDFYRIQNVGLLTSYGLVLPNPDPSTAAIPVDFSPPDTVTTTYLGEQTQFTVLDCILAGGGGGGLVRPGLVVNVLAGAGGGGGLPGPTITLGAVALSDSGSEVISMPQEIRDFINDDFDPHTPLEPITNTYEDFDLPLSINGNSFALGGYENTLVPQTVKPGETIEFTLVFYTTFEIAHTSLNFNLGPTRTIAGSDTQVLLYKDKFEIVDPNGNIATATGSLNNDGDLKRVATFSITFSDDIQWSNSDLVIRSWNENLNSGDIIVYDAIEVLPSEEEIAFEESLPEPEVEQLKSQYVPIWIKNNAAWWSQELIDDSDFVAGIEHLIQNEIITIQDNEIIAASYSSNEIPVWIKNNAGWWSENLITEKEFIDGLQWLISNGIIRVTET